MATRPSLWRAITAASIGAYHVRTGLAYEDAYDVQPPSGTGEPSLAVAIADGHGHARHFRSARGARLAVEIATKLAVHAMTSASGGDALGAALRTSVGPHLVTRWRRAVEADIGEDPPSPSEIAAAGLTSSATLEDLVYGYGSTAIVALATPERLLCAQIGDGDAIAVTVDGRAIRLVPADPLLDGWRTTSLCQPDARSALRYGTLRLDEQEICAVLLATDGYGNAQLRSDWDELFAADLVNLIASHGVDWVSEALPSWVRACASADGSGDDVTAVLLFREYA
jgi:serine/threonine protein phosphatase PrpC